MLTSYFDGSLFQMYHQLRDEQAYTATDLDDRGVQKMIKCLINESVIYISDVVAGVHAKSVVF